MRAGLGRLTQRASWYVPFLRSPSPTPKILHLVNVGVRLGHTYQQLGETPVRTHETGAGIRLGSPRVPPRIAARKGGLELQLPSSQLEVQGGRATIRRPLVAPWGGGVTKPAFIPTGHGQAAVWSLHCLDEE